MRKILVSKETFELYQEGKRTFVEVPRNDESYLLKEESTFGDKILLINETTHEKTEETLWFVFDYDLNDLYLLFVFGWKSRENLLYKRMDIARSLQASSADVVSCEREVSQLPDFQKTSYAMLVDQSAFFFTGGQGVPGNKMCFFEDRMKNRRYFIILDVLKLPTSISNNYFGVRSLFPLDLLGP